MKIRTLWLALSAALVLMLGTTTLYAAPTHPDALAVRYAASAQMGADDTAYHIVEERAYAAGLSATFGDSAPTFQTEAGVQFSLALSALNGQPVSLAQTTAHLNRFEYQYDGLTEWYVAGPLGFQHGFTLKHRPAAGDADGLTLSLNIVGVRPEQSGDGALVLHDLKGRGAVDYGGLLAWDADGTPLEIRFVLGENHQVALWVDDSAARYPITIDPYIQQRKLNASDAATGDQYGFSVAISGDTAIVGAPQDDYLTFTNGGSVYVYVRTFTGGLGTWAQQAKLTPTTSANNLKFGRAVALSGDTAVIGSDTGAYVFTRSGTVWTQQTLLAGGDALPSDHFGMSVALNGSTLILSAPYHDTSEVDAGAAYVFTGGGASWTQQAKLTSPSASASGLFGVAVDLSGDLAVVGEPGSDVSGADSGAVHTFTRSAGVWSNSQTLTGTGLTAGDGLGSSVATDGTLIVAGAPTRDHNSQPDSGAAFLYTYSVSSFAFTQIFSAAGSASGDRAGAAVDVQGRRVVVGLPNADVSSFADAGAVVVYGFTGTAWAEETRRTASDSAVDDKFGIAVALDTYTYVIGAELGNASGATDSGAAYVLVEYSVINTPFLIPLGEGVNSGVLPVRLTSRPVSTVSLSVDPDAQCDVGAGAGAAIILTFTTANFATPQNVTITPVDDNLVESGHSCSVVYTPSGDTFYNGELRTNTITIVDNDQAFVSVGDVTTVEGNTGSPVISFTVTLTNPVPGGVSMTYSTTNGTALAGVDYVTGGGTVNFPSSSTAAQTVNITLIPDRRPEQPNTRQFTLTLSGLTSSFGGLVQFLDSQATGTITDDDAGGAADYQDTTCLKANTGDSVLTPSEYVAFNYGLGNGAGDVMGVNSRLLWDTDGAGNIVLGLESGAGSLNDFVVIYIDSVSGGFANTTNFTDESSPQAAAASGQGVGTTVSAGLTFGANFRPDYAVVFTQNPIYSSYAGLFQLKSGEPHFQIRTLSQNITNQPNVRAYELSGMTGVDIGLAPGGTFKYVATLINPLTAFRYNEFVGVESAPVSNIGANLFSLGADDYSSIQAFDPAIMTIDDHTLAENGGNMVFNVTASRAMTDCEINVFYSVLSGSAITGQDFGAASPLPVLFEIGQTTKTITVPILEDDIDEANEQFSLLLVFASNGTISADGNLNTGTGTITDNDNAPTISINSTTLSEGNSATSQATLTLTLTNRSASNITVRAKTLDGTALATEDYIAFDQTVTLVAGQTSIPLPVQIVGDLAYELTDVLSVELSAPTNAILGTASGTITINNNDAIPSLSVVDAPNTLEPDTATTNMVFSVQLSQAAGIPLTVDYFTSEDAATLADLDYMTTSGTLSFPKFTGSLPVNVPINGDTKFETDERLFLNISNPTVATLNDVQGQGLIANDDTQPVASVVSNSHLEGGVGSFPTVVEVVLSNRSYQTVTVNFALVEGTATQGIDFNGVVGTLTFLPDDVSESTSFTILGDDQYEANETVLMQLTGVSNGSLDGTSNGVITILDDDTAPALFIPNLTVEERNTGSATVTFTVTQNLVTGADTTFTITLSNGTATNADNDYEPQTFNGVIPRGETEYTFDVTYNGDIKFEADETVTLALTDIAFANAGISTSSATLTLTNDDTQPKISIITPPDANEGTTSNTIRTVSVELSNASYQTVSVVVGLQDGNATLAGGDYVDFDGTLTFAPDELSKTFDVTVLADNIHEDNEDFTAVLTNAVNGVIDDASARIIIINDDGLPTVTWTNQTVIEGTDIATDFNFTLTLSNPSEDITFVVLDSAGGTATPLTDYAPLRNALVIWPAGTTQSQVFNYDGIVPDVRSEALETFNINLTTAFGAQIGTPSITVSIIDDETETALLTNTGFDIAPVSKIMKPTSWKIAKPSTKPADDFVVCNVSPRKEVVPVQSAPCSMMFKGGGGENTRLTQNVAASLLTGLTIRPYDGLRVSYSYNSISTPTLTLKITHLYATKAKVVYVVQTPIGNSGGTWQTITEEFPLYATDLTKVTVQFLHKTPNASKLYIDDVNLVYAPLLTAPHRRQSDATTNEPVTFPPLPLPETFRGGN